LKSFLASSTASERPRPSALNGIEISIPLAGNPKPQSSVKPFLNDLCANRAPNNRHENRHVGENAGKVLMSTTDETTNRY
jgi:hypothetical protein